LNGRIDEASQLNDVILKKTPQDAEAFDPAGADTAPAKRKWMESVQSLQQASQIRPRKCHGALPAWAAFQLKGSTQQAKSEWREAGTIASQSF